MSYQSFVALVIALVVVLLAAQWVWTHLASYCWHFS